MRRVFMAFYFIELLFLIGVMVDVVRRIKAEEIKKKYKVFAASLLTLVIFSCFIQTFNVVKHWNATIENAYRWQTVKEYCSKHDNLYLLDVVSFGLYTELVYKENRTENRYLFAGGWPANSPLLERKLKKLSISDCGEMMYDNDNTYLIVRSDIDYRWLEDYFAERFGKSELVKDDVIEYSDDITYDVIKVIKK